MNTNALAGIASLVGEPARAAMLLALVDGRSLTAGELAQAARITAPTASRHLGLLVEAGLLHASAQGRHRYHRLASAEVAGVLEGILRLGVSAAPPHRVSTGPRDAAMRFARTCYDHLAGRWPWPSWIAWWSSGRWRSTTRRRASPGKRAPHSRDSASTSPRRQSATGGRRAALAWTGGSGACTWQAASVESTRRRR